MGCSSSTVEKTDFAGVCRFCEKVGNVKWKCLTCKHQMCQKCVEKKHAKIPNAGQHRIIDIREENEDFENSKQSRNIKTVELKNVEEFSTDIYTIFRLTVDSNNSIWMYDINSKTLQRVNINGSTLYTAIDFNMEASGMAAMHPNKLILATFGSLKIYDDRTREFIDSSFTISPFKPKAIHVTRDNKLIIGAENDKQKKEFVIVMNEEGKQENVFEYDKRKKPLFKFIAGISSTSDGTIGVVDWLEIGSSGQITIIDKEGNYRNSYSGHPHINNEEKSFKPSSIVTTKFDNFAITDFKNNTLHFLNNNGFLIAHINTEDFGICNPYYIAFNRTGQLYIGTNPRDNEKANLYRVQLIEC